MLLKDVTLNNREDKETQLLREAIKRGIQRVDCYYRKMHTHLQRCRSRIDETFTGKDNLAYKVFRSHINTPKVTACSHGFKRSKTKLTGIVWSCYAMMDVEENSMSLKTGTIRG
jgi:hypothetical protein